MRPLTAFLLSLSATTALAATPVAALAATPVPPAAHKATYELTLENPKGNDIQGAHGTMAYEVTDACDGWASLQRLTLDITNREGQTIETVSDYVTWESKDGLRMRFRMRQTTDTAVTEQVEGDATLEHAGGPGTVHYTTPEDKRMPLPSGTVFPMAHTEAILAAAADGKRFVSIPLFDGTGDKGAQDSSVFILGWDPKGGTAPYPALADMANGRVRIAFYDRTAKGDPNKPDGAPDYQVAMKYWANGVGDDLHMDFSEFIMKGILKDFTIQPPHC